MGVGKPLGGGPSGNWRLSKGKPVGIPLGVPLGVPLGKPLDGVGASLGAPEKGGGPWGSSPMKGGGPWGRARAQPIMPIAAMPVYFIVIGID